MAGEAAASPAGLVQLDWNTLATAWGPMAIILGWFMVREDRRDKRLYAMMEKCTDVMAKVNDRLAQSDAGDEKNRAATYRLADEIKDLRTEILALSGTTPTRNTRIMPKEE